MVQEGFGTMDILGATPEEVPIVMPLGVNDFAKIYPGNIIVIAGEQNAGKTAFLLNTAIHTMYGAKIVYINSEMGEGELRLRLEQLETPDISLQEMATKVTWLDAPASMIDAIVPGKGVVNIIDFLEIHDEFWKIGKYFKAIHDKLDGAVAIVAIQKDKSNEDGRGGGMGKEKARLYLTMGDGWMKAVKVKNPRDSLINPNGWKTKFVLENGVFRQRGKWRHED